MNVKNFALVAILGSTAMSTYAAGTGTIDFTGEIKAATCKVDVNGQGNDALVTLPTVAKNAFSGADQTAGLTAFSFNISECTGTDADTSVKAYFESGPSVDLTSGRLVNMATEGTVAKGIDLQLVDVQNNYTAIKVGSDEQMAGEAGFVKLDGDSAEMFYAVQYYSTESAVDAGLVQSTVNYSLQYK